MKRIYTLVFVALFSQMAYSQTSMNNELAALRNALSENAISSVVVLRMPDSVLTRIGVTPQVLREAHSPTRKYSIEMSHSRSTLLMDWIKQASFMRTERTPDCRWGLLFMDRNGKEVGSIFSDKLGLLGNVDGHNVDFSNTHLLDTIHGLVGPLVH